MHSTGGGGGVKEKDFSSYIPLPHKNRILGRVASGDVEQASEDVGLVATPPDTTLEDGVAI